MNYPTPCFPRVSISRRGKFSRQRDAICSLGGTIADLFTLDYSRDMERQADALGTRLIASKGYAADGLL